MHDFLLKWVGKHYTEPAGLHAGAKHLARVRDELDGLPATKTLWKPVKRLDCYDASALKNVHLEFLRSWPAPDRVATCQDRLFVNPGGSDAERYPDVTVECDCGATVSRVRVLDPDNPPFPGADDHGPDCDGRSRKVARARLKELRADMVVRLARLGWRSEDMAPRLGIAASAVSDYAKRRGHTIDELHREYRRDAGETYAHLVRGEGVSPDTVAAIYDRPPSTLRDWVNRYTDAENTPPTEAARRRWTTDETPRIHADD